MTTAQQSAAVRLLTADHRLRAEIETPLRDNADLPMDHLQELLTDRRDLIATRHDVRDGLWAEFRHAYLT